MIDDYAKVMELMRKMDAQLPIPARPTGPCRRLLREQGVRLSRHKALEIKSVHSLGDEAGITCDVTPSPDANQALLVSITHLRIDPRHPLAPEIHTYQKERMRRLAASGGTGEPSQLLIHRRKNKKRRR